MQTQGVPGDTLENRRGGMGDGGGLGSLNHSIYFCKLWKDPGSVSESQILALCVRGAGEERNCR